MAEPVPSHRADVATWPGATTAVGLDAIEKAIKRQCEAMDAIMLRL